MKILVTGSGSLLGQGIIRCLRWANKDYTIIAADPSQYTPGNYLAHKSFCIPMANDDDYIQAIENIIIKEAIQLILVGTDVELLKLSLAKQRLQSEYGVKIVVADTSCINMADSKWLTAEFLKQIQAPFPNSVFASDRRAVINLWKDKGFPLIAKPDRGARSIGFVIINDKVQLDAVLDNPNNLVIQEYLPHDEGEFTSGCLIVNGVCKSIITLKRELKDGNTIRTYRDATTPLYDATIKYIAEQSGIQGPCNFQFRIRNGEPVVFEINARFSGTTPLRCLYGFNEVDALVEHYFYNKSIIQSPLKLGMVLRTFSDMFIDECPSLTDSNPTSLKSSVTFYHF